MSDLVAFLNARLGEDEAAAKRAEKKRRGPWWSFRFLVNNARAGKRGRITPTARDRGGVAEAVDDAVAAHIARHDPARVLREVEAKRKIRELHYGVLEEYIDADGQDRSSWDCAECETPGTPDYWPCPTLHALAAVYSDHPDYDPAWG